MVLQVDLEGLGDDGLYVVAHLRVTELVLGLTLELRVGELHADGRGQALSGRLTGEVGLAIPYQALLSAVVVHDARKGGPEAGQVGATVVGVDAVGE